MSEPIHIISLGAGVQSSTMALMSAHGEITPMPVCAIFADTQDEPASVYKWLDWLEKELPFPVYRVTKGSLSQKVLGKYLSRKGRMTTISIPFFTRGDNGAKGHAPRQCTSEFKIYPIDKEITVQMRRFGVNSTIKWIGISMDEAHRMKPSRRTTVEHRWPLVDAGITRKDCEAWMLKQGYPKPPRSACVYCPYHSDYEWQRLKTEEPDEFDKAVEFEKAAQKNLTGLWKALPFLHRSHLPLIEVDFEQRIKDREARIEARKPLPDDQLQLWGNECEGMCGL